MSEDVGLVVGWIAGAWTVAGVVAMLFHPGALHREREDE